MADGIEELERINQKIRDLENAKNEIYDRLMRLNRKIRFKKFEQEALIPFLEETKHIQIIPLRKKRNKMEFMIATAAYTPRHEREWIKEMKKLDEELEKVKEVEKARRKKRFVDQDIEFGEKEIVRLEKALYETRDTLRRLYDEAKSVRMAVRRTAPPAAAASPLMEDDMVSLEELAMIVDRKDGKKEVEK